MKASSSLQTILMLVGLAALWGASYLFMRILGPNLGVAPTAMLRFSLAALVLLVYTSALNNWPDFRTHWQKFLLLGLLNNVIPQTLIVSSVVHLNASLASILNATTPLFTALVAAVWLKERFGWQKALGVVLGIIGVGILVGFSAVSLNKQTLLAVLEALLAALSYGVAAVYTRRAFREVQPLHTAVGQLCGSSLIMGPLALPLWPQVSLTPVLVGATVGLAVCSTAIAYLLYFRLIATAGATPAASVTFLIPFFSLIWASIFLHEPLNAGVFGGLAVILLSVALVLGLFPRIPIRMSRPKAG